MATLEELSRRAAVLRAELRKVEEESHRVMSDAQPLTAREESQMADFQARADAVYSEFGGIKHAPAPFAHERPGSFKRRVLNDLRQYSDDLKDVDFIVEKNEDIVNIFETQVLNDALRCAKAGGHLDKDVLTPISRIADSGARFTEFKGPSFLRQFQPTRRIMRIRDPKELRADMYR